MSVDKEFEAFRQLMLSQFARLAENAGRYIGKMSNEDRETVLADALINSWCYSGLLDLQTQQLANYWDFNIREAVTALPFVRLRSFSNWDVLQPDVFLKSIPRIGVMSDE